MIKKVIQITKETEANDSVELSWFDMQKPNLSALTNLGVAFIIKAKFTHLHVGDILICEDGYKIEVKKTQDEIYILEFTDHIKFAKIAYEIGNRHQPITIEDYKITVLDDQSISDIISNLTSDKEVKITKTKGYFHPNGKSHHSH
ncbi:MAG: urease accessory protein UreE [Sulfurospirillaceae bacterium]|nr:urease accessory protein UreE [Sulfurospirillaceae bacterium]